MKQEQELKSLLTGQEFDLSYHSSVLLETLTAAASGFANATEGIAVISDFRRNVSHIYAGKFGQAALGLDEYSFDKDSAFENDIFRRVLKEDLLKRHILELRFYNFLNSLEYHRKTQYQALCPLRMLNDNKEILQILHATRYLHCHPNGSVLSGLCTYIPFPYLPDKADGWVVDMETGKIVMKEKYAECGGKLLSDRQKEVLALLAKGMGSKHIADILSISTNTVNRHRQDILAALRVSNSAAAVEIGLRMNLI